MDKIMGFFAMAGISTVFITPLTLIIGIINAIRKPEDEAMKYIVMAIISAYLIIMPLMYVVLRS